MRLSLGLWAGVAVVAVAVVALTVISGSGGEADPMPEAPDAGGRASITERFATLSSAESNRCDLGAAELREMSDRSRLQGSCCSPMDEASYKQQLRDLHRYGRNRVVPADSYDISVVTAKRLIDYRDIALDRRQQAAYERATELSEQGGPCCCPCWRWEAFKGQAHFLLARRNWTAAEVAALWDAEEGCGGPGERA